MKKILVIEDEDVIRENIVSVLNFSDFDAAGAKNGSIGLQQIREARPDLIISDIMMPEMSGYELLEQLRDDPNTATIPFIFLTAKTDRTDWRKGVELGADDYITKPFSIKELLSAVETRFKRHELVVNQGEKKLKELRDNLTRSLPHEFRTPLTAILGFSQHLVGTYEKLEPDDVKRMLETIHTSAERLHNLVQNYLLYAQLELTRVNPERLALLRKGYLSAAAAVIKYIALRTAIDEKRKSDLVLAIENAGINILEEHLKKVLEELVSNAFKFSKKGTPVSLSTTATTERFMIQICDQGKGMSLEQIKSIGAYMQFERKLHEQKGVGLGLIIAKNIVELYGGTLTIESELEQGTIVTVELNGKPPN